MAAGNHDRHRFLRCPSPAVDCEAPRPLHIKKQASLPRASEPQQQCAPYRVPASSAAYGASASPPPPAPLPYPDERTPAPAAPRAAANHPPSRTGTPHDLASAEEGRAGIQPTRRKDSMASQGSGANGARPTFDANDPNRPTAAGYLHARSPAGSASATRLAERRGAPPKTIFPPDSPGGPEPPLKSDDDDHGLFQVKPRPKASAQSDADCSQHFYPPPLGAAPPAARAPATAAAGRMHVPDPAGINRLSSTASTSTTKASRGSPPPPETPIDGGAAAARALAGIEARYAASGTPGTSTLNEMQAQSAAAAARRQQYAQPEPTQGSSGVPQPTQQSNAGGRWSPTEPTGSAPHGPPIAFQGVEEVASRGDAVPLQAARDRQPSYPRPAHPSASPNNLAEDMNRMNVHEEPPPAYSPPAAGSVHSPYPNDKGRYAIMVSPNAAAGADAGRRPTDPNARGHPAFANDPPSQESPPPQPSSSQTNGAAAGIVPINIAQANQSVSPQPGPAGPASPPPLPEGWIAHLDNNSGHYYYIHLPTQLTQWEFPKGPTPLHLQEPMSPGAGVASPVASVFKQPLASPGFPAQQMANYDRNSILSMHSLASPTASGFTGPPPSAGVDMYKIAPSNAVYFGPYLRYTNLDLERGLWLGSIMLITDASNQPPTIHLHQSQDLSPNPRQLKAHPIHSHQRWIFYRYDIDLRMDDTGAAKWTYAITSHLGCTRYEFLVAARLETSWRFVAHSGNDFAMNVSANDRSKLGGAPLMWKDVLVKHQECGGFHTQIGLGGQICADRLWKDIPALRQWTQISGKENRKNAQWTAKMEEDVTHAYFHYYTSHFDQPAVKEAFAQIPHVCCLDDHDIFDGYGSYPEYMQESHVFKNLGRIGIEMYLLFQHHTTHEILRNVSNDIDLFTITGKGWHFLKYLGPSVVIVGPDTRSERNEKQVMAGPTYQGIFPKVATLPPSVQHCIWLMPVPIIYPRLEGIEQVASTVATGKKLATGSFNMLGKVTSGVAGIVGAKGVVNHGFDAAKKAVGKSGLMQGVLSPFGNIDMLDELRDLWTHESKDLERTYIIRTLQGIAHNKSLRMTFLSGSVNSCGAGLVHDPQHPSDHKTMYQLITSSIVDAPTPSYVIRMLHNHKQLYIPANGRRSLVGVPSDTKEDMMEIFAADVDGRPREHRRLMGRRNYLACVAYDPELVQGAFGPQTPGQPPAPAPGAGRLSLAADFMVQNEGPFGQPMKYGPIIIPSLEYGR